VAVLNSWKEISAYSRKGVRTVQRWEAVSAFPVHRPSGKRRSSVFALSEEVDHWLQSRSTGEHENKETATQDGMDLAEVRTRAHELRTKGHVASVLVREVQNNMRQIMAKTEKYRRLAPAWR
jgi:type IV secretory pathway VirJ component